MTTPKHQRQVIREAVQAALKGASPNYNTSAGARVQETRLGPHKQAELPAVAVYTLDESVDVAASGNSPRELARNLDLAVEGWARASSDVDDSLDALALEIERAMHADPTFGGTVADSMLGATEIGMKLDGDRPMGCVRLVYSVRYYTFAPDAADVTLDRFDTADIQYNLAGAQEEDDRANDILENLSPEEP